MVKTLELGILKAVKTVVGLAGPADALRTILPFNFNSVSSQDIDLYNVRWSVRLALEVFTG